MKTSFLTVTIAPAPFLFSLHALCGHSWVVLISILIDVQYLQNDGFCFEKGLNGQMHSRVFWHTVNYTACGYMLKADGHLMGKIPGRYRFLMFQNGLK